MGNDRCVPPPSPADIKRKSAPITHAETEENCCTARGQYLTTSPPHCTRCWPICIYTPLVRVYTHSPTRSFSLSISRSSWARVHGHTHTHTHTRVTHLLVSIDSLLIYAKPVPVAFAYYSFCEIYLQSDSRALIAHLFFPPPPSMQSHEIWFWEYLNMFTARRYFQTAATVKEIQTFVFPTTITPSLFFFNVNVFTYYNNFHGHFDVSESGFGK